MLKVRPPTHKIDGGGTYIASQDCWDQERIVREMQPHWDSALAKVQAAAIEAYKADHPLATEADLQEVKDSCELTKMEKSEAVSAHPWSRYLRGLTRYSLDSPEHDMEGKPVTVRDYLKGDPTVFVVRRLSFQDSRAAEEILIPSKRLEEMCKLGLREIRSPAGGLSWKAAKTDERVPDDILQALHEADASLINQIGSAVIQYNRPLDDDEGKR